MRKTFAAPTLRPEPSLADLTRISVLTTPP